MAETKTNAENGCCSIENLQPGLYQLEIHVEGYVSEERVKKVTIESGRAINDTIFVKKSSSISGVIRPFNISATVSVARDSIIIDTLAVRSDDGVFEVRGLFPGQYQLVVSAEEYKEHLLNGVEVGEGQMLDLGAIELQRMKKTTPQAKNLVEEGKRLHLSAEFERAQAVLLEAITTQEMTDQDLAEAYLWLAYSYFPFAEQTQNMQETLTKSVQLDPQRVLDDSFSPEFRQQYEKIKERIQKETEK
jgi:hypothetical protein